MVDDEIRASVADVPVYTFDEIAYTAPPPLARARVAIVTTAGLRVDGASHRWDRTDVGFSVLPDSTEGIQLAHASQNFDRTGFMIDPNVVFPVDRLHELADEGVIGSVASQHLSFMGAQPDYQLSTIRLDSGPAAAALLAEDGVDVVLLTPV